MTISKTFLNRCHAELAEASQSLDDEEIYYSDPSTALRVTFGTTFLNRCHAELAEASQSLDDE